MVLYFNPFSLTLAKKICGFENCSLLFGTPKYLTLKCANPIPVTEPSNALLCGAVSIYLLPAAAAAAAAVSQSVCPSV